MNLRWLLLDYVDPALPLSRKERRQAWRRSRTLAWRNAGAPLPGKPVRTVSGRQKWLMRVMPILPSILVFTPIFIWMSAFQTTVSSGAVAVTTSIILSWVVITCLGRWTWKPFVNKALREQGFDVCNECGYWLRGLNSTVANCPECGATRKPIEQTCPEKNS